MYKLREQRQSLMARLVSRGWHLFGAAFVRADSGSTPTNPGTHGEFKDLPTICLTQVVVSGESSPATGRPLNSLTLRKLHARLGPTFCARIADSDVRSPLDMRLCLAPR